MNSNDAYLKNVVNDRFAKLLGIEILKVNKGYSLLEMKIEEKHKNGIDIVQGGAIFTLADYAFGVASNADGSTTIGINASISYYKAPKGRYIRAEAKEQNTHKKICGYEVKVKDDDETLIALFTGLGYRKIAEEETKAISS